jgi:hypothetical protein
MKKDFKKWRAVVGGAALSLLFPVVAFAQVITNPLNGVNNITDLLKKLISVVIQIGIPVAVFFIVWSGFDFIFAKGDAAKIKAARERLLYTLVGVAIMLGSFVITQILQTTLTSLTQ